MEICLRFGDARVRLYFPELYVDEVQHKAKTGHFPRTAEWQEVKQMPS